MKITSKIENEALNRMRTRLKKAVSFSINIHELDSSLVNTLQVFWATKSNKTIIEKSIAHTASLYLSQGHNLLEMSNPDRLWLLNEIERDKVRKQSSEKSLITVRACSWQLFLIISQAEIPVASASNLIDYCLHKTAAAQASLFNEILKV